MSKPVESSSAIAKIIALNELIVRFLVVKVLEEESTG